MKAIDCRVPAFGLLALLLVACSKPAPPLVAMPEPVPKAVLISQVDVLDVRQGQMLRDQDVLIEGERISRIEPAGSMQAPADVQRINGDGATLLPGLIDMHAHLTYSSAPRWAGELPDPPRNLQAYLYSGVTAALDTGAMVNRIFDLKRKVESGELLGPHMQVAGPMMTATGGHPAALIERLAPWWIGWYVIRHQVRQVDTPQQAQAAVQEVAGLGADVIKVMVDRLPEDVPRIDEATLRTLVQEASEQGLRTVAHVGTTEDAILAAEAGVKLWVHGIYKERIADADIERLAAYGIPMVPTSVVFENYALLGRGPREATQLERETASAEILGAFDEPPQTEEGKALIPFLELLHSQRANWRDNVRRLRAAGVTILAGSDTQAGVFPGAGLHRELMILAESEMSPAEVLRSATYDGARWLAQSDEPDFGLVEVGKRADLLLVNGDPSESLEAVSDIRAVLLGGVPLKRQPIQP